MDYDTQPPPTVGTTVPASPVTTQSQPLAATGLDPIILILAITFLALGIAVVASVKGLGRK
jgi:hypothetical protein